MAIESGVSPVSLISLSSQFMSSKVCSKHAVKSFGVSLSYYRKLLKAQL